MNRKDARIFHNPNPDSKYSFVLRFSKDRPGVSHKIPGSMYKRKSKSLYVTDETNAVIALRKLLRTITYTMDEDSKLLINQILREERELRARRERNKKLKKKHYAATDHKWTNLTLKKHQQKAYKLSILNPNFGLFMEQGTGKTLPTLGTIHHRINHNSVTKVLYVCPLNVILEIDRQIKDHINHDWRVIPVYDGGITAKASINSAIGSDKPTVVIINYTKVRLYKEEISIWNPDMVVVDESHKIKDGTTQTTKVITDIGHKAKYRMILTGTPIGNSVKDLFSQFRFLEPSIFGSHYPTFRDRYLQLGKFNQVIGVYNLSEIKEKTKSITYRITKRKCLDITEPVNEFLWVDKKDIHLGHYKQMEKEVLKLGDTVITTDFAMNNINKRQQIISGFIKDNDGNVIRLSKNPKLKVLMELLEYRKSLGKKTVVFTNFIAEFEDICGALKKAKIKYITTKQHLEFTKDSNIDVAVIQMAAGAEGINLTAADMGVFYSINSSYLQYSQCLGRIDRQGLLKNTGVRFATFVHILVKGGVDEKIYKKAIVKKKELSEVVLDVV